MAISPTTDKPKFQVIDTKPFTANTGKVPPTTNSGNGVTSERAVTYTAAATSKQAPAPVENPPIKSWSEQIVWQPQQTFVPQTRDELSEIVRRAQALRIKAAGHSFNESLIGSENAVAVDMKNFDRVGAVQKSENGHHFVTIEAGTKVRKLNEELSKQGFAIRTLPTSIDITIGGAAANGVHATGMKEPAVLSDAIVAMTVIDTNGQIRVLRAEEELKAARTSLGSMGIILDVTLRCVPAFNLQASGDVVSEETAVQQLDSNLKNHDHVMWFWSPDDHQVTRFYRDPVIEGEHKGRWMHDYDVTSAETRAHLQATIKKAAVDADVRKKAMAFFMQKPEDKAGPSHFVFQSYYGVPMHDQSMGIPLENLPQALSALRELFVQMDYHPHLPLAVRFLGKSDKSFLAMNYGRDTAVIEMFSAVGHKNEEVFLKAQELLLGLAGRVHWAKEFSVSVANTHDPKAADKWLKLQRALDPARKLENDWTKRIVEQLRSTR